MAVQNGTATVLTMDGTVLANLTNVSASFQNAMFEVTSKESGGWKEILPGLREVSYTAEGITNFQSSNKDIADIYTAFMARASVAIVFTDGVTGDKKVTQTCYIESCEIDGPLEDASTYSITFMGTGVPVVATI